jgi:glutathionylspermidine synthase
MERILSTPRPDWQTQVESLGHRHHTINNQIYWNEHACYRFESQEIDEIKKATNEIEKLCLELVDHVVRQRRYAEFQIPEYAWPLIDASWRKGEKSLYGRMDFSYDGTQPPKLLEYNADTPLCLLEASLVQKQWFEQVDPSGHQFNNIHESLVAAWAHFGSGHIHLTCRNNAPWLLSSIEYLSDTLSEAGFTSQHVFVEKIDWNGRAFVDEKNGVINTLFKITPWEWMKAEIFGYLLQANTRVIEPAWKMILSNKGLLVLLWDLFPGHPNLLPSYFDLEKLSADYVKKPLLGREGKNISLYDENGVIATEGHYGNGAFMYQQLQRLPHFDGNYPVIGSWVIAGKSCGMIIREDDTPITCDLSRVVPHFFN